MSSTTPLAGLDVESVAIGDAVPAVELPIDVRRVVMGASATRDFFPGHHSPEYAQSQGLPTIYLNTMTLHGFIDRTVTDWAGATSLIARRTLRIVRPTFAGELARCGGVVSDVQRRDDGAWRFVLQLTIRVGDSVRCTSSVTVLVNADGSAPAADAAPY